MKSKILLATLAAALFSAAPALAQSAKPEDKPKATQPEHKDDKKHDDHKKDDKKHDDNKDKKDKKHAKVGEAAPTFTGTDSNGNTVSLTDLTSQGKIVILQWFNPECPYVKKHYEGSQKTFNEMATKYKDKNVVILAIDSGGPGKPGTGAERVNKARKDWNIAYPVILDESGEIGKAYGAQNTPAMAVIGKDGKLAYFGAIDDDNGADKPGKTNYVTKAVDELLANKPVTTATTKPYGCGIRYKD